MPRRSEDVSVVATCEVAGCPAEDVEVLVDGRFNAEGEFEAFDPDDLFCDACGSVLATEL